MNKENEIIMEAIKFFKYGNRYGGFRERMPYLKALRTENGATYNGFIFKKDLWCWIVWKPTDIGKNPEYKGEPLCKVIPDTVPVENIPDVLDVQPWTYI